MIGSYAPLLTREGTATLYSVLSEYILILISILRQCYNGYPHGTGHGATGGLMKDPIDSCNDALFFMHHAYLDKL
jgi:hypothetical protein